MEHAGNILIIKKSTHIHTHIHTQSVEEMDMNLATTAAKESHLERLVDSFTEAMQTACRESFKTINTQNKTKQKKSVPW